jgi:hypothetical protein
LRVAACALVLRLAACLRFACVAACVLCVALRFAVHVL